MRAAGLFGAAAVVLAGAPVRAGHPSTTTAVPPQEPEAFRRVCVRCHASDKVVEGRRYRSQWEEVLNQMVARGATGTDEEFEIIFEYLVSEFGRVSINTAPGEEIAHVLHLEGTVGDAIVQHRTNHGKFADFDALAAVPGIPVAELRKRRDAIVFQ